MELTLEYLGHLHVPYPRNRDRALPNRILQKASKEHKDRARSRSAAQLAQEAHTRSSGWLRKHHDYVTDLLSDQVPVTKVAVAGDWHCNAFAAAVALRDAADAGADVLVQLGDLGVWPGYAGQRYADCLEYLSHYYGITLLFIDGNHEDFPQLLTTPTHEAGVGVLRPGVLHLRRGTVWTWAGHRFGALGGAPSIDKQYRLPGATWWPEEQTTIADVDLLVANTGDAPLDVLFTHETLTGAPLPSETFVLPEAIQRVCDASRALLSHAVEQVQPKLLMHGHYHEFKHYQVFGTDVVSLDMELTNEAWALLTLQS